MMNEEINREINKRINKGVNEKINKQINKNEDEDENEDKKDKKNKKDKNKEDGLIQLNELMHRGAIYIGNQLVRKHMRDIANEVEKFLEKLK
jgi:hypothetical protein